MKGFNWLYCGILRLFCVIIKWYLKDQVLKNAEAENLCIKS